MILVLFGCQSNIEPKDPDHLVFRDTTVVTSEWHNGLLVHHHVFYDSTGQVHFETEQVTAIDTVFPHLSNADRTFGRALSIGPYTLWTPSMSSDTFRIMVDTVRLGHFKCTWQSRLLSNVHLLERRTAGYGTYSNTGFLIVPEQQDTVLLWTMVDFLLPKPAVWNWEEVTPMTYDEYKKYREDLKATIKHLATRAKTDSLVQANK